MSKTIKFFSALQLRGLCLVGLLSMSVNADDWQQEWRTDFTLSSIPLSEIVASGLGKDGFRSLENPEFEYAAEASSWLESSAPVIAVAIDGQAKAYPLQILMYHELVNDNLSNTAITITYCPLCNAAMVFNRLVDGQELEFGISGQVYASNMVMYDRQTESWWLQFTGEGIVGEYVGKELTLLPSQIVSFKQFAESFPSGQILSKETGFNKKYGTNPYLHYDSRLTPFNRFFPKPSDPRLPALERVLGVVINDKVWAYPFSELRDQAFLQDKLSEEPVLIIGLDGVASAVDARQIKDSVNTLAAAVYSRTLDNRVLEFSQTSAGIVDTQTQSLWNLFGRAIQGPLKGKQLIKIDKGVYFAFVWLDFYPQTQIFPEQLN